MMHDWIVANRTALSAVETVLQFVSLCAIVLSLTLYRKQTNSFYRIASFSSAYSLALQIVICITDQNLIVACCAYAVFQLILFVIFRTSERLRTTSEEHERDLHLGHRQGR